MRGFWGMVALAIGALVGNAAMLNTASAHQAVPTEISVARIDARDQEPDEISRRSINTSRRMIVLVASGFDEGILRQAYSGLLDLRDAGIASSFVVAPENPVRPGVIQFQFYAAGQAFGDPIFYTIGNAPLERIRFEIGQSGDRAHDSLRAHLATLETERVNRIVSNIQDADAATSNAVIQAVEGVERRRAVMTRIGWRPAQIAYAESRRPENSQIASTRPCVSNRFPSWDDTAVDAATVRLGAASSSNAQIAIVVWGGNQRLREEACAAAHALREQGIPLALIIDPSNLPTNNAVMIDIYARGVSAANMLYGIENVARLRSDLRSEALTAYRRMFPR